MPRATPGDERFRDTWRLARRFTAAIRTFALRRRRVYSGGWYRRGEVWGRGLLRPGELRQPAPEPEEVPPRPHPQERGLPGVPGQVGTAGNALLPGPVLRPLLPGGLAGALPAGPEVEGQGRRLRPLRRQAEAAQPEEAAPGRPSRRKGSRRGP